MSNSSQPSSSESDGGILPTLDSSSESLWAEVFVNSFGLCIESAWPLAKKEAKCIPVRLLSPKFLIPYDVHNLADDSLLL